MPSKHNLSVSLTEHLRGLIEAQIASGRFRSASEVARTGLRLLERELAEPTPAPYGDGPDATARDAAGGSARPGDAP